MADLRALWLENEGIMLKGQLCVPGEGENWPLVILCHGVPLSLPDPSDGGYPALARKFVDRGITTLFFNLRGTGGSGGNFHPLGWANDFERVVRFAQEELDVPRTGVYLVGFSVGGALSLRMCAREQRLSGTAGLAVPSRLTGIFDLEHVGDFIEVARRVGIIRDPDYPESPADFLEGLEELDPIDYVDELAPRPLLLVHGEDDELISPEQARELFAKADIPKRLELLPGAGHRLRHDDRAVRLLLDWVCEISAVS